MAPCHSNEDDLTVNTRLKVLWGSDGEKVDQDDAVAGRESNRERLAKVAMIESHTN